MFKRFVIGFALGMAATHYAMSSSIPLLDDLQHWLSGTASGYKGQKTHRAADRVFDHDQR